MMLERRQRHDDRRRPRPLSVAVVLLCLSVALSGIGLLYAKHGYTLASTTTAAVSGVDSPGVAARSNNGNRNNGLDVEENANADLAGGKPLRARAGGDDGEPTIGLVVVVMPSPPMVSGPMTRMDRLRTIGDTWGRDLISKVGDSASAGAAMGRVGDNNRLVFVLDEADTATDEALRTWDALGARARIIVVPTEVYDNGADGDSRLRHVLGRVSATYDPAFLFFCNEHTFVIVENLRSFVRDRDPSEPVYLGNRFRKKGDHHGEPLLNSGAAGFVLSRASLSLLRGAWGQVPPSASHSNLQQEQGGEGGTEGGLGSERREGEGGRGGSGEVVAECVATSKFERSNPGVTLARCLSRLGVNAEDTTDSKGGQRFNAYGPVRLAQGAIDQWYKDVHASDPGMWRAGPACCSRDTISFHYVGPAEAKAMHTILHNREMYLERDYEKAFRAWPVSGKELGGYSAAPRRGDPTFDLLLGKIRLSPPSLTSS